MESPKLVFFAQIPAWHQILNKNVPNSPIRHGMGSLHPAPVSANMLFHDSFCYICHLFSYICVFIAETIFKNSSVQLNGMHCVHDIIASNWEHPGDSGLF